MPTKSPPKSIIPAVPNPAATTFSTVIVAQVTPVSGSGHII